MAQAGLIPAIIGIGSSLLAAKATKQSGEIKEQESNIEAKQIETAAAQREADRKDRLARAIASQSARAGGAGIAFEGSPLRVLEEDIRREGVATERDVLQTRVGATTKRMQGRVAKKQAKTQATMSLLQTGAKAASLFPTSG